MRSTLDTVKPSATEPAQKQSHHQPPTMVTNLAHLIQAAVRDNANRVAIYHPFKPDTEQFTHAITTFADISQQVHGFQSLFANRGWRKGDHVLIIALPQQNFFPLMTAMLASAIIPVFIDPRMGYHNCRKVLKETPLVGLICETQWQHWRFLIPELWSMPTFNVELEHYSTQDPQEETAVASSIPLFPVEPRQPDDIAMIAYTSGTTGQPKGVVRTHGKLIYQFHILRELSPPQPGEIGLTFLPTAILHGLCLGMTSVMPAVNPLKLDQFSPAQICQQVSQLGVTCIGGSPFFLMKILNYLQTNNDKLPSLRLIVIGSAGAQPSLFKALQQRLPHTETIICYGATEVEPIATVTGEAISQAEHHRRGYLVGSVVDSLTTKIINTQRLEERLQQTGSKNLSLSELTLKNVQGETSIGEIIVSGPQVLVHYTDDTVSMDKKFYDDHGSLWHRTGDRGCFDDDGHLWLAGRVGDEIQWNNTIIDPFGPEIAINEHPNIVLSALIQTDPTQPPTLVYHTVDNFSPQLFDQLEAELSTQLASFNLTGTRFRAVKSIPVDNRHNSKINRKLLRNSAIKCQYNWFLRRVFSLIGRLKRGSSAPLTTNCPTHDNTTTREATHEQR